MKTEELNKALNRATKDFTDFLPEPARNLDWRQLLLLDGLNICKTDDEFEDSLDKWEKFLNGLDKFWNKANAFAKSIDSEKKRQSILGYLGNINQRRNSDELLLYLDKARNSSQHTLHKHIRETVANEIDTDAKGIEISYDGQQIQMTSSNGGTMSGLVMYNKGTLLLSDVKVVNQQTRKEEIYSVPTTHNGESIYYLERVAPHIIGKFGLLFYHQMMDEISKKLIKK